MERLTAFVPLQRVPRLEDYLGALAAFDAVGRNNFDQVIKLFAQLVRERPGVPRTGVSFYRAVSDGEIYDVQALP